MPKLHLSPEDQLAHTKRLAASSTHIRFFARYIQNHLVQNVRPAPDLESVAPLYLELAHTLATDKAKREEFLRIMDLAI